jgi:hypothetical protein
VRPRRRSGLRAAITRGPTPEFRVASGRMAASARVATPEAESREGPSPSPDASPQLRPVAVSRAWPLSFDVRGSKTLQPSDLVGGQQLRRRTRMPRTTGNTGPRPLQARWSRTSASARSARSSRAHTRGSGDPWRLRPGAFLCPWRRFRQNPRPTLLDLWLVLARRTSGLAPERRKAAGRPLGYPARTRGEVAEWLKAAPC